MKTHLNLGLAFRDAYGTLIVNLQLMPACGRAAIGIADFHNGVSTRFLAVKLDAWQKSQFRTSSANCAALDTVKSLEWAYPSSDNAVAFGYAGAGCWTIQLGRPGKPAHAVRAFPDAQKEYALSVCRDLPFAWSPITLRVNPEYSAQPIPASL